MARIGDRANPGDEQLPDVFAADSSSNRQPRLVVKLEFALKRLPAFF
jgi:hypothetical protein